MSGKSRKSVFSDGNQSREDRLKAALKANMARRKAQARARQAQQAETDASLSTSKNEESR
ncbi:MAG: hypothetical protein AAF755_14285 [Pseudomonadota bacterium]